MYLNAVFIAIYMAVDLMTPTSLSVVFNKLELSF